MIDQFANRKMCRSEFVLTLLEDSEQARNIVRIFCSSLLRTLFDGGIVILSRFEAPIFKVDRTQIREVYMPRAIKGDVFPPPPDSSFELIWDAIGLLEVSEHVWLNVVSSGAIAIRGVDHLFPTSYFGNAAHQKFDMLIASHDAPEAKKALICVRSTTLRDLIHALPRPKDFKSKDLLDTLIDSGCRFDFFEKGEIYYPKVDSMDWRTVSCSSLIITAGWESGQSSSFLCALYYNLVLSDQNCYFMKLIDP